MPKPVGGAAPAWSRGFDQPYRRQRFYGSGNVQYNAYNELDQLNNTSWGIKLGWDWETIERLSGRIDLRANQNLGNYGGANDTLIRTKNVQDSALAIASVQYGLVSLLAFTGRVAYSSVHYSAPQYARYELDQASINLGALKQFGGQLTLGTGVVYTDGDYFSIGQQFDRYDVYLNVDWRATGLSRITGRLAYSDWSYTGRNTYDTSSVTGFVRWDYVPSGKLSFNTLLSYDTLANSGLTDVGGGNPGGIGDTSQLTGGLQFGVKYALSAKINLTADLNYYARTNDTTVNPPIGLPPGAVQTRDRVTALILGASWTPTRNWLVNCSLNSRSRNQSADQPVTLTPYDSWGGSCSAQFALQ